MIVLNCNAVDFADLFSGEYRTHAGMIWTGKRRVNGTVNGIAQMKKAARGPPRLPPAAAPTVRFSRISKLNI